VIAGTTVISVTAERSKARRDVEQRPSGGHWRFRAGRRLLVLGAATIGGVGVVDAVTHWPLLTTSIGPTAYVLLAHPETEVARLRNAAIGHGAAIGFGLAALALFGLWSASSVEVEGHASLRQAGAAAVAVGLTLLVLELCDAHHAPAAATAVLVATDQAQPGKPLLALVLGLACVLVVAPLLAQVRFGQSRPRPRWKR
jgi:HPP family